VLALCCDHRVMVDGPYRIGLPETQVGLVAPAGLQLLMRRAVGIPRAVQPLVPGALAPAAPAHAIGLVDALAPPREVPAPAVAWRRGWHGWNRCWPCPARRCCSRAPSRAPTCAPRSSRSTWTPSSTLGARPTPRPGCAPSWRAWASSAQPAPVATGRAGSSIHPLHEPV